MENIQSKIAHVGLDIEERPVDTETNKRTQWEPAGVFSLRVQTMLPEYCFY